MSREEIIIRLLRDYEYLVDDSDYCRIAEIRMSIAHIEDTIRERKLTYESVGTYI